MRLARQSALVTFSPSGRFDDTRFSLEVFRHACERQVAPCQIFFAIRCSFLQRPPRCRVRARRRSSVGVDCQLRACVSHLHGELRRILPLREMTRSERMTQTVAGPRLPPEFAHEIAAQQIERSARAPDLVFLERQMLEVTSQRGEDLDM